MLGKPLEGAEVGMSHAREKERPPLAAPSAPGLAEGEPALLPLQPLGSVPGALHPLLPPGCLLCLFP